jgi:DNA-binding MurR/RpiR family transcriptional regulator
MLQRASVLDLVGLLRLEKDTFSRSERRLIDVVLGDIEVALNSSIVELAALADVSPPTVTRFCRRLGCESFSAFKVRLAQSRFLGQRYLQPPGGPETVPDIARHIVNCVQSTLYKFFESMDGDAVQRASVRIAEASYVLTFGSGGASSMIALELENRLFRLGLKVAASVDHQGQLMRAAGAPKGTVIVASSMSGNNAPLAKALAIAGCYGIRRIVMTRPETLVAAEADILLGLDIPEAQDILRPSASRYAFLAMTDVIAQVVATRMQAPAIATMRRIKHQLVINRDGDDTQALGD